MNHQEVVYSFPRYEYEASGVWHETENQSLTAFLGNFPRSFGLNLDKDPPTLDDNNSISCVAAVAGLSFLLEKSADEVSENCSVQINKNENCEIKTDAHSGTPSSEVEVTKTEPKPAMPNPVIIERPAPNKNGGRMERRPLRNRTVPYWHWQPIPIPRMRDRSTYNSSLRFRVYGFLTRYDLWHVPVSHPMIPRWVQEAIWDYDMEKEREFRDHRRWMSVDYFPNHARNCWLCMDYRGKPFSISDFDRYYYNSNHSDSVFGEIFNFFC